MGYQVKATNEEINRLFQYWYENNRNFSKTAEFSGRDRKSLWRYAIKYDWASRADRITANVAKGVDRQIAKRVVSNVEMAESCLKREVTAYLENKNAARGNIRDIVALMKYIDEAGEQGRIADAILAARKEALPYDPDLCDEIIGLLQRYREKKKDEDVD
jgi:hypothetical protein